MLEGSNKGIPPTHLIPLGNKYLTLLAMATTLGVWVLAWRGDGELWERKKKCCLY